ncbi:thiol:disulfide interchange protein DsbD [Abditibacteriota bacterium]|nr:thiol:disulfide interchange protein DsbD [Abditibacteriota bacterium]
MNFSRLSWLVAFVLAFGSTFGGVAHAQNPVKWSAIVKTTDARAGEVAKVELTAKMEDGWHIYAPTTPAGGPIATKIEVAPGARATLAGKVAQPKPLRKMDAGFGIETETFEKVVTFGAQVKLGADAKSAVKGAFRVRYQACNARLCLPPKTVSVPFEIKLVAGKARPERQKVALASISPEGSRPSAGTTSTDSAGTPINIQKGNGSVLAFLVTAFGAGLLALLTPCVFPMIPITVSLFTPKNGEKKSIAGPIVYCAGIIGTFTLVGVLVSVVFGAAGLNLFAANPYVNLALATLFIVLALNLFGAFEIIVPASILNRVQPRGKSGLLAPFLMGLAFTLTSFTCTVPFVGTTLTTAATQGVWLPALGMLAFSTAFALPFFLLSLFPSVLSKMPRAGEWLISVKAFMGFLELAAALKFLQTADQALDLGLITRPVFLAIWFTLAVVAGLYLLRVLRLSKDSPDQKIGPLRKGFGIATLGAAAWILAAFNGGSLHDLNAYLPPRDYGQKGEVKSQWVKNDLDGALALAKTQNKPLLINFTGNACTNCRLMENDVLPNPVVTSQLGDFVAVELITDGSDAKSRKFSAYQQQKFGTIAIPLYAVITPDGKIKGQLAGLERDPDKFAEFLRQSHSQTRVALVN